MFDDRSQAYTLEGVVAAVVVLTAMLYGLQIVDPGPWTSDTSEETRQLEAKAQDVLDLAADNGTLQRSITCFRVSGKGSFDGGLGTNIEKRTVFEQMLRQTFDEQNVQYNIYFRFWNTSTGEREVLVSTDQEGIEADDNSAPSDSTAVATRTVTIYDDSPTYFNGSSQRDCGDQGDLTVKEFDETYDVGFYMDDIAPESPVYNVVEVRIVAW